MLIGSGLDGGEVFWFGKTLPIRATAVGASAFYRMLEWAAVGAASIASVNAQLVGRDAARTLLLRAMLSILLLLLVDLLLTLQDLLHELQRFSRRLPIAERILDRLRRRLGRIVGLPLGFELFRVAAVLVVRGRSRARR